MEQVQTDLIKDGGYLYFIKQLESDDPDIGPESRAQAAFILAAICKNNPKGQLLCAQAGLVQICLDHLPATVTALASAERSGSETRRKLGTLVKWLMICFGQLCEDIEEITAMAIEQQVCYIRHFSRSFLFFLKTVPFFVEARDAF